MNNNLYSNIEFTALKEQLNREILRRGTYKWWDPLTIPSVGEDKTPPLTLPDIGERFQIDENTYSINNPSEGSIEPTRNIRYPSHGENPAGQNPNNKENIPNTSAALLNSDEMRNLLVGLAKIQDINLFYGRDEIEYLAFRDPKGIEDVLTAAQNSDLSVPLKDSNVLPTKNDPNGGVVDRKNPNYPVEYPITYPMENDQYVMPSGEYDGEEALTHEGLGVNNFYDDYGAKPGDANYHPTNRYISPVSRRDWNDQDHNRNDNTTKIIEGGVPSARFGPNPRNPQQGNQYRSRPVFGGKIGACNVACFRAGTLIETINGPVPIEEIKVGDEVLTQSGKYHMVYENSKRECDDELIAIRATGTPIIYTTFEHPFWVKKYIGIGKKDGKLQQLYSEPEWVEAKDIKSRDKLCLLNKLFGNIHIEPDIAYMVGRWLGDGWVENQITKAGNITRRYCICCAFNERYDLEEKMNNAGIIFSILDSSNNATCQKYHILHDRSNVYKNKELISIIDGCGKYSYGKYINQEIYNWDKESIENLLQGYIDSDGSVDPLGNRNRTRITTVSKKLAYGTSLLMRMIGRNPSWYERSYFMGKGNIQGRTVNMRNSYNISMFTGEYTRHYSEYDYENNVVWSSVTLEKIPEFRYDVYNLSVDEDHTYYADGVLVHNCTGLCYMTCDNQCSESCSTTCWNRCGEACTASCGNVCTGCSTMCYSSCKTKCENSTGYSCLKAGAKAIKITTTGGKDGQPASNHIKIETHSCEGCSFSCQFYPNKKTECWDAGCMGKCFTSCTTSCSTSCYGGCIDNASEEKSNSKYPYKTGKGRGCSSGCTLNCIGLCSGVCEGYCVQTCFNACKGTCSDNCSFECSTNCGSGCDMGCTKGCTGCSLICTGECTGQSTSRTCVGCGSIGGCTSSCQFECDKNCMGFGCRSICGIDTAGACEANCRLNCTATSCTAMCSDACSQQCSTCVNTCGFQCGACTSSCSIGCGAACNITCTQSCSHSCETNCVHSCSEECGGCSNLCYSCIGMCIGVCSVKCEDGCSSCANNCGWWCDSSCSRECFGDCSSRCISTCSGSCATFLTSNTTMTEGPERDPIAEGYIYPHPKNRWEERESFKLFRNIPRFIKSEIKKDLKLITIAIEKTSKYVIFEMNDGDEITKDVQQIYDITKDTFITNKREIVKDNISNIWRYYKGKHVKVKSRRVYKYNYVYIWNTNILGEFNGNIENSYINRDSNIIVVSPKEIHYDIKQTSLHGGIFDIDPTNGNITINESMIPGIIESTQPSISTGGSIFIITLHQTDELQITNDDIDIKLPFGFEALTPFRDKDNNVIVIIRRDPFLFPEEEETLHE